MKLTLLGTGDVRQVPVYGCNCAACFRARIDISFVRKPCSALLQVDDFKLLIDGGLTDLCHRFTPGELDGILLTHYHVDHVQGLFHLRWGMGPSIPVYGPEDQSGCADLLKHPGILDFQSPLIPYQPIELGPLTLTPLPLQHSKPAFGYFIEHDTRRLAYLTDTVGLPPKTEAFLLENTPDLMVLDCTHPPAETPPRNHNDLNLALAIHEHIAPQTTVLTHISHQLDAMLAEEVLVLPQAVCSAEDGMEWLLDESGIRRKPRLGDLIG